MIERWNAIRAELAGSADAPGNIAEWTLARHVRRGAGDRIAIRWRPRSGPARVYSYTDLDRAVTRFASGLRALGVGDGERVVIRLDPTPELAVAFFGAMRAGAVPTIVATTRGWGAVGERCRRTAARVVVAAPPDLEEAGEGLPEHRLAAMVPGSLSFPVQRPAAPPGWTELGAWMARQAPEITAGPTDPEAPAMIVALDEADDAAGLAVLPHATVVALAATGRAALGLGAGTRAWVALRPGSAIAEAYALVSVFALGATTFLDEAPATGRRLLENLVSEGIQVLVAPAGVLVEVSAADGAVPTHLRLLAATDAPLDGPDADRVEARFRVRPRPVWSEPEVGAIVLAASDAAGAGRPPTWGVPTDPFDAAVVVPEADGLRPAAAGEPGVLAVRAPWPSMFRALIDDEAGYAARFRDGWYLSRQRVTVDDAGAIRPVLV